MNFVTRMLFASSCLAGWVITSGLGQERAVTDLPAGVQAVWDLAKATHETTPTRERICLNGLWLWQPGTPEVATVPPFGWGWFKVPGPWPGIQDYMQSDYQRLYPHPRWKEVKLSEVRSAWYQREIQIPASWAGRRLALDVEYLNSYAVVFVDGRRVGDVRFPGGQSDLTDVIRPGSRHVLSLSVDALPLKALMQSYTDTNAARQRQGSVPRRGLCGDVWITSQPAGPTLQNVRVRTSFRKGEITFATELRSLPPAVDYRLRARITDSGRPIAEFHSPVLAPLQIADGGIEFTASWNPPRLWDLHTPENQYSAELSLLDANGNVLDTHLPVQFGFREFWADGRDFWLNGTRVYLSLVPLDNAEVGTALATYGAARESFRRLKSFGINFVYTHNYGCEPGSHLGFTEILRAADDTGMLVALSQPHFSAYDWKSADADRTNGYQTHAAFYTAVAGSHPSVVCYAMSHNATGYNEDMNPVMIDGLSNPRDQWAARNAALAVRCEAIVRKLDPSRLVYHHSSGNLGAMYTMNFYPNFVPIQELDDWFEHWATEGVKPLLLVEYGAPFGWDWTMYRGWSNGRREFGSAVVPWEYCLAEWNAQFLGDVAYRISERERRNLRWEAEQFRQHRGGWHRWDYPFPVGDRRLEEMQPVQAAYTTANWRAFRTWGISGNSPWEHDRFWKLRDGFVPRSQELAVDWEHLQQPGYSSDFIDRTYARFDLAYERADWIASPTAQSLLTNNAPVLAWIAGSPEHFTSREHTFFPGETLEKQLIIINNSRRTITGTALWSGTIAGSGKREQLVLNTGEQRRLPLHLPLPADLAAGRYSIRAALELNTGERQEDALTFEVVPRPHLPKIRAKIALFDPAGQTASWLSEHGHEFTRIGASNDLAAFDVLLIGQRALNVNDPAPDLSRVREGLKVVVYEQTAEALQQRLGFRVAEYGLRQAWARLPDSPVLQGLSAEQLRDWRGASTLVEPHPKRALSPRYNGAPTVQWCGLEVTRLWRCGNWGTVASVLIEKPARGDFLPILEGGYALQYSPLLEYREGRGMVLFCQVDLTARTETEPAAEILAENTLRYIDDWKPAPRRTAVFAGDAEGKEWLRACGIEAANLGAGALRPDQVLVIGPGAEAELARSHDAISAFTGAGGHVLALGLDPSAVNAALRVKVTTRSGEHIAAWFPPFASDSPFAGISPADLHNRDPRDLPLIVSGATAHGDGVIAADGTVVFCQLAPFQFSRAMRPPDEEPSNLRRTFVRSSFGVSRILANLGVSGSNPLLDRFSKPGGVVSGTNGGSKTNDTSQLESRRWLEGLYLTRPTEWDDPYRFFRW